MNLKYGGLPSGGISSDFTTLRHAFGKSAEAENEGLPFFY